MKTELQKCSEDIFYFKEKYLHLQKDELQDECIRLILNNNKINLDTGRQSKKTYAALIVILHKFLFEDGINIGIAAKNSFQAIHNLALIKELYDGLPDFFKENRIFKFSKTRMDISGIGINKYWNVIVVDKIWDNAFCGYTIHLLLVDCLIGAKNKNIKEFFYNHIFNNIIVLERFDAKDEIDKNKEFVFWDGHNAE